MKKLVKWLIWIAGIALMLLIALLLSFDWIVAKVFVTALETRTGMSVGVDKVHVGILSPKLRIVGLRMNYPAAQGGGTLLKSPELYAEYDRDAARRHELHFREVRLSVDEINVVESGKKGSSFMEQANQLIQATNNAALPTNANPPGFDYTFKGIDKLTLNLGELRVSNLANPKAAQQISFDIHDMVLTNVTGLASFTPVLTQVLMKMMMGGGVPGMK